MTIHTNPCLSALYSLSFHSHLRCFIYCQSPLSHFPYSVKYAELKQSLDYVEKEREIDLKEREAIVYRAESLQREFDHVNKLLQVINGALIQY